MNFICELRRRKKLEKGISDNQAFLYRRRKYACLSYLFKTNMYVFDLLVNKDEKIFIRLL